MPDIQTAFKTALSRTLQQWDDDDGETSPQASPTINTTINNSVSVPSQTTQGIAMLNTHKITNNVSRVTFNYVRDNPGSTRLEIIKELGYQGFGKGSVSSLLAQMRKAGMAHDKDGLWYADVPEYIPIKNLNYKKKVKAAPAKKATAGIGALLQEKLAKAPVYTPDETPPVVPQRKGFVSLVRNRTPESIIDNMTVYQARELYEHLKKLFGG